MPAVKAPGGMRRFTVIAQDPYVQVDEKILTAQVQIPKEHLRPGPAGHRVHVIDYDASTDTLLEPAPSPGKDAFKRAHSKTLEGNPHFHAQNVYAIVMSTLAQFEKALGRRVHWGFHGHQLKIAPHAFADANAYYSRENEALLFGYFPVESGTVFTCLSHDIVAHETTHALLDGLRNNYLLPSSEQQAAFHEGFADVVALLSVFKLRSVVDAILTFDEGFVIPKRALTPANLKKTALIKLADQMGKELTGVRGDALRHSAKLSRSRKHIETLSEPHDLGEVLVAAMLNSFLEVWLQRLFPHEHRGVQFLDRAHVVDEGATAAEHLLTMAIRAIDYAPPVDLQFGDFLSALLTADTELNPDDSRYGYRKVLRKVFAGYGIDPTANGEGSGLWDPLENKVSYADTSHEEMRRDKQAAFRFIWHNREALRLEPNAYTYVQSVRPTVRTNRAGFVIQETVVEYVQVLDIRADELLDYNLKKPVGMKDWQRVRLRGGAALIFDDRGQLRHNIGSGVNSTKQTKRLKYLFQEGYFDERGPKHADLAHIHRIRSGAPNLRDPYLARR